MLLLRNLLVNNYLRVTTWVLSYLLMLLLELKIVKGLLNALAQIDPCRNLIPITQYWVKILAVLAGRLLLI